VYGQKPQGTVFALEPSAGGVEIYGESAARPLLSAAFDLGPEESADRVIARSAAELRLENAPEPVGLTELMQTDQPKAFAAALTAACRLSSVPVNLLPLELREVRSAWQWAPTAALGALVLVGALVVLFFPRYQNGSYLESLNSEIAKVQPRAQKASALDKQVAAVRARTLLLDNLRKHGKNDLDVLASMTSLLAPPAWLRTLEMTPKEVNLAGETDQATPLLKQIDSSPLFEGSEFTSPPSRAQNVENFSIRTKRTSEIVVPPPVAAPTVATAPAPGAQK
jgi:Tfp pilus assembly protein PilN